MRGDSVPVWMMWPSWCKKSSPSRRIWIYPFTRGIHGRVVLSWPMMRLLNNQSGSLIGSKTKARCEEPVGESNPKLSMAVPKMARPRCCDLAEERWMEISNSCGLSFCTLLQVQILIATNLFDFVQRFLEAIVLTTNCA